MMNQKQKFDMADIFRRQTETFPLHHVLHAEQRKAFDAIVNCRTLALGGHMLQCSECSHTSQSYNSCRNRHCPKCQAMKKAQWVDKLTGNLPAVKYFHIVFTIPHCLHKLFYINQHGAYGLLFKASGASLTQCAQNTQYLGARAGAVGLLHTWGQTMAYHPHIHMIVPAGGLSEDGMEWVPSHKKFFLPVKVLSSIFRGIMCRLLEEAIKSGKVKMPEGQGGFEQLKALCYQKKWAVYCKKPFSGPENLIHYLGNYTHRVAISNHRIVGHNHGKVSFYYKDNKRAGMGKVMTLDEAEFVRRFMLHVLPRGFSKIRYFGFLTLRYLKSNVDICNGLLDKDVYLPTLEGLTGYEVCCVVTGCDPLQCKVCKKGRMQMRTIPKPAP
jgi:hypothetical protein